MKSPNKKSAAAPPLYTTLLSNKRANAVYDQIRRLVYDEERYLDPSFSARQISEMLGETPRTISSVMQQRFGMTFPVLMRRLRVAKAIKIMTSRRGRNMNIEEIATLCGYDTRQSFYNNFRLEMGTPPAQYLKSIEKTANAKNNKK